MFLVDLFPPNHARTHTEENVVSLRRATEKEEERDPATDSCFFFFR
jgi:hypothetical protein